MGGRQGMMGRLLSRRAPAPPGSGERTPAPVGGPAPAVVIDQARRSAIQSEVAAVPVWFHSLDLGEGVITPGTKSREVLEREWGMIALPELKGKTLLDIGAWDGFFSFAAEKLDPERVVALDHYVWCMDHLAQREYVRGCRERGVAPRPYDQVPELWRPHSLPGKQGFDVAHRLLGSRVESLVADFMAMDLEPLGTFDVVLCLGVLYHLENPLLALRRLAQVTGELAVIETVCVVVPGREEHALWELFAFDELNGDSSNWWASNATGLINGCRAAGFSRVEVLGRPAETDPPAPGKDLHYGRMMVRAWKS